MPDVSKRAMEDLENFIKFYQNSDVMNGKSIQSCLYKTNFLDLLNNVSFSE
jgi:hypothetical protein